MALEHAEALVVSTQFEADAALEQYLAAADKLDAALNFKHAKKEGKLLLACVEDEGRALHAAQKLEWERLNG